MASTAVALSEDVEARRSDAREGDPLEIRSLTHAFGDATVVNNVSLKVPGGQIASVLGPSGCGKTTILRLLAGLLTVQQGEIRLGDDRLDQMLARKRRIGLVFQNYALFPHLTVRENIAYGLAAQGVPPAERRGRVERMLDLVRMGPFRDRLPKELSGGQQQRTAFARALAIEPRLLLLDEPFAALDKDLRLDLQIELVRLQKSLGTTTILVTHDQEEALSVSDLVVVMRAGRIEQVDTPISVYDQPASLFVNLFVGRASTVAGQLVEDGLRGAQVALAAGPVIRLKKAAGLPRGSAVIVSVRPEHVSFAAKNAEGAIPAVVTVSLPLGPVIVHELLLADNTPVKIVETRAEGAGIRERGEQVHVHLDLDKAHIFAGTAD